MEHECVGVWAPWIITITPQMEQVFRLFLYHIYSLVALRYNKELLSLCPEPNQLSLVSCVFISAPFESNAGLSSVSIDGA